MVTIGLLAGPLAAHGQQAGNVPRVAFLTTTSPEDSPNPGIDGFRLGLRDLGYIEGQSIAIEWRWGRGRTDQFPQFAAEVVRLKVDVIAAANTPAGRAAQMATKTIPIVIPFMSDPVGDRFAATLAKPGSNITGLSNEGSEITSKRLQLFKEALPNLPQIAVVADTSEGSFRQSVKNVEAAARALGVRVQTVREVSNPSELAPAFTAITKEGVGAVFVVVGTMTYANRARLVELALKRRVPLMCGPGEYVRAGCRMGYGASVGDLFRRAATYVDKILKGAKPGDLPVEQPTKFDLGINLKTAKALGLTIPPSLLARADEVIE